MMADWIPIVLAILAAIPGLLVLSKDWRFGKPDALQKYEVLVSDLRVKNDALECRLDVLEHAVKEQEAELEELRSGVVLLIAQLKANGIEPVWKPKERKAK